MCHKGTRIGRTKAIDRALKASKNVALPMTMRARPNQRNIETCSRRAIRLAAASSGTKSTGEAAENPSDRGSALTTDKVFSRLAASRPFYETGAGFVSDVAPARATSARLLSAITFGHSIGVRWRTFGKTDSVAFGIARCI